MRLGFGLIGLLIALAIVGVLVKKQMTATKLLAPVSTSAPAADANAAPQSVREQSQQIQQQYKQQLDTALQQGQERLDKEAQ